MDELTITLESSPAGTDIEVLSAGLSEHSLSKAFPYDHQGLAIFIRNPRGEIVGGLAGATVWGWLHISLFWLAEELRGKGFGKELIGMAETEALARGCKHAHLDTFSFQALGFYQKLGYEVFAELEDYPQNARRFYLKKALQG
jgi:ribosomal protein S18 acetylase RimI-like enzyme